MAQLTALALLCFAGSLAPIDIAWKPRAGTKIARTYEITAELRSESFEMIVDGKPLEGGYASNSTSRLSYRIVDEFGDIGPDRPARLVRHFETLERIDEKVTTDDDGSDTETIEYESALEGKRVSFEWQPQAKAWKHAFAGEDSGDAELLKKLTEDMDLRAFLPGAALEVGESYEVAAEAIGPLLMPGGDVGTRRKKGDSYGAKLDRRIEETALTGLKGKLRAKLTEVREIEGVRCAVIEIEGEIRTAGEVESEDGTRTSYEHELEPRGELVWDLEARRARSITITMASRTETKSLTRDEDGGKTSTLEMREKLVGTTRIEAKFEAL